VLAETGLLIGSLPGVHRRCLPPVSELRLDTASRVSEVPPAYMHSHCLVLVGAATDLKSRDSNSPIPETQ
jgi:hypothetical protein